MDFPSSDIPFTSDPALLEDWKTTATNTPNVPPDSTSDLEALHLLEAETTAKKTANRVVIQHRSWKVEDVFRSDIDHQVDTPLRPRASIDLLKLPTSPVNSTPPRPSNLETFACPRLAPKKQSKMSVSSPVQYPTSPQAPRSSPPQGIAKRPASPMATAAGPKRIGAFIDDSDDENIEDFKLDEPSAKRRMLVPSQAFPQDLGFLRTVKMPNTGSFIDSDDETDVNARSRQLQREINEEQGNFGAQPKTGLGKTENKRIPAFLEEDFGKRKEVKRCDGKVLRIPVRQRATPESFESMIAAESKTRPGRAQKSFYGVDILALKETARKTIENEEKERANAALLGTQSVQEELPLLSVEKVGKNVKQTRTQMWTEKYRARRFLDLCGDDRTHRDVLRWLKGWDHVVFPSSKNRPKATKKFGPDNPEGEKQHRKILLLTGPAGLGKTTLAHVCAMQAGYEVMEINASDDRSSNVVKGRLKTTFYNESVKSVNQAPKDKSGPKPKPVRPLCVVVDEVDGVTTGSGAGGEGGFMKALIDLVQLDARNSLRASGNLGEKKTKRKEDDSFRLLRPMILICNDIYAPSLRPLRQSNHAEVIHIRKPPIEAVVSRMKSVFVNEGIGADADAVRCLCESTWGMSSGPESGNTSSGTGEGDLRSVLVVGEWVARKLRYEHQSQSQLGPGTQQPRLTKRWVERHVSVAISSDGGKTMVRGGSKEVVSRVFITGAGFPLPTAGPTQFGVSKHAPQTANFHAAELAKRSGIAKLREMVDTSDEHDRIVSDVFALFPAHPFNDDSILTKPDQAYEWMHFYATCSQGVYQEQSWELMPYLSSPILACHELFATTKIRQATSGGEKRQWEAKTEELEEEELPYTGLKADYEAKEATKHNRALLIEFLDSLRDESHVSKTKSADLARSLRNPEILACDFLPYLLRIISPEVKPVVVGGSDSRGVASVRKAGEKAIVQRAVIVMASLGVRYQRGKLEGSGYGAQTEWVYRMEPPLDEFMEYPTADGSKEGLGAAPVRYAIRQVLDQEYAKAVAQIKRDARQARFASGNRKDGMKEVFTFKTKATVDSLMVTVEDDEEREMVKIKKDFFGRVLAIQSSQEIPEPGLPRRTKSKKDENKVWVTYHEGFSNAVRKPITVEELLRGL